MKSRGTKISEQLQFLASDWKFPEHRKTVRHFDEPGHAHFLTFSCFHRMALLSKDRTRNWLVDAIGDARAKHRFHLWTWVIMPEHVHLLIWPPQPKYATAPILADIKRPVGQKAIAWLKEHSPGFLEKLTVRNRNRTYHRFWQAGPGQDHNIYEPETAHEVVRYVHENPVHRGLVPKPEDWSWSSARDWMGCDNVILKVDRTLPAILETET